MKPTRLTIRLRPSPVLAVVLTIGHGLGLLALAISLDGFSFALTAAGVMLSAIRTIGEALQRWPDSPLELELRDGGRGAWLDRRGCRHETSVAAGGYVSRWLIIVALKGAGWRRKWIVLPLDAADGDARRRLRVWLRWRTDKIVDPEGK